MGETATAEQLGKKFSIRHYEALRREALAPAIGRIGVAGAGQAGLEVLKRRRRTEVISLFTEAMKPESLRSVIDNCYPINQSDGRLSAEDGEPIEEMLARARQTTAELASEDPFFEPFLAARAEAEIDEHAEQNAMARGETAHNTMITFSPYSEEFDDGTETAEKKLIKAEQKPYWKRAMVRVSHAGEQEFHVSNISIDNCSVELLRQVAKDLFDYEFEADTSTEMLGERLRLTVLDDSWRTLTNKIAAAADQVLERRTGIEHKQGNPKQDVRQAQTYVESQTQIVDGFLAQDARLALLHDNYAAYEAAVLGKTYDAIALLETRLALGGHDKEIVDYEAASAGAGAVARAETKSYDACGLVINAENQNNIAARTGFESLSRLANKKIHCPECSKAVKVPKKDLEDGKLTCGECGYWLDVCTGRKGFTNRTAEMTGTKDVSGFEIFSNWWRKTGHENNIRRLSNKQRAAESESEKKRLAKRIKGEEAELQKLARAA